MSEPGAGQPQSKGGLTYADYAALPDDGQRYQLVEGELLITQSPTSWHQWTAGRLFTALTQHVETHALGKVLFAPLDVVLDDRTVVQPDILFIATMRASILQDANVRGAPDLCVEILSPGSESFDRVRKLGLYACLGVAHYWIVDIAARSIEEYVLHGDVYRVRSVSSNDHDFCPAAFPGLTFRLASVGLPENLGESTTA